jgi:DNA-binding SARP family transcriptional activator
MRSDKHFRLKVLGRLSLESSADDIGRPLVLRPRHLAIFAFLAMSERAVQRDSLVAMFWGDEPEANARHSLSNALSALRGLLGASAITSRRDIIELSPELLLAVDALEFAAATDARDDARAAELYAGPFLHDVAVQGAPDFDAWVGRIRNRLERAFISMCERRVPALLRAGNWDAAAELSERWLRAAPRSPVAFASVLRARSGSGTPESIRAALADFVRLRDWLAADYDLVPDPTVRALADELESRRSAGERQLAEALARADRTEPVSEPSPPVAAPTQASGTSRWRKRLAVARLAIVTTAAAVASAAVFLRVHGPHAAAAATRTVVAITGIESLSRDTAIAWLQDGLPQLISDDLAAGGTLETVSPIRVRDVLDRRGAKPGATISESEARDVARRVGATWFVRGGLTGGGGAYILNLDVRDVATGSGVESFTVMADNPVKLGQLAAARLLEMATSTAGRADDPPRFVGATTNPEAYRHFVLGMRAMSEGRYGDDSREFEAAIALDSGFVEAMSARHQLATMRGETAVEHTMAALMARHADRLSDWDRARGDVYQALWDGEVERSEALAQRLVARYPRDPRSYVARSDVLGYHGRWLAADSVLVRELSLDSLAMEAGDGPCAPCAAYGGLVSMRLTRGDLAGAELAARRWVALQPGVPGSWNMLSMTLEFGGHMDQAIEAGRRMVSLTNDPERIADLGRTFTIARRFDEADSVAAVLRAMGPTAFPSAVDLAVIVARERGQFHRAAALLADSTMGLELVQADNLMRIGRVAEGRRHFEASGHFDAPRVAEALTPPQARAFAWAHALEADAYWRLGDTIVAHTLVDSVRTIGARSYYGRDWGLHHHLAGLLALARHDTTAAERELQAARWGVSGWTSTVALLARIRLAHGDANGAIALLRDCSESPLNAMGRYVTRTELDLQLSLAFARAGEADSAAVYADRVRAAWRDADPEVKRMLAEVPGKR